MCEGHAAPRPSLPGRDRWLFFPQWWSTGHSLCCCLHHLGSILPTFCCPEPKKENDIIESLHYTIYYTSRSSSIQGIFLYADLDGCICSDVVMYEGMFLHAAFRGYYVNQCMLLSPMFDRWLSPRLCVADQVLNKTLYIPCAFITHFGKCILSEPSEICAS